LRISLSFHSSLIQSLTDQIIQKLSSQHLQRLKILDEIDVSMRQNVQTEVPLQLARPAVARKSAEPDVVGKGRVSVEPKLRVIEEENLKSHSDDSNSLSGVMSLISEFPPESLHLILERLRNGADGADEFVNWRISEKGDYDAEYDQ
jgi:hypothetical protein